MVITLTDVSLAEEEILQGGVLSTPPKYISKKLSAL